MAESLSARSAAPPGRPPATLHVVEHALVAADLARLRSAETPPAEFRRLVARLSTLVVAEATRDLPTREVEVRTPLETTTGRVLAKPVVLVPILRAGLGMLDAALALLPEARVGHLGVSRDEATRRPVPYYQKLPPEAPAGSVVLLDPMLATGGTAVFAADALAGAGCDDVRLACLVAAPEGVAHLAARHPAVRVYTAAYDRELDANAYIRPGLGDAGDRIFGTL